MRAPAVDSRLLRFVSAHYGPAASFAGTKRALDVGCGTGVSAVWLAEQSWRVDAVDTSPSAIGPPAPMRLLVEVEADGERPIAVEETLGKIEDEDGSQVDGGKNPLDEIEHFGELELERGGERGRDGGGCGRGRSGERRRRGCGRRRGGRG
jgi:SAM-dependent methyltransferase